MSNLENASPLCTAREKGVPNHKSCKKKRRLSIDFLLKESLYMGSRILSNAGYPSRSIFFSIPAAVGETGWKVFRMDFQTDLTEFKIIRTGFQVVQTEFHIVRTRFHIIPTGFQIVPTGFRSSQRVSDRPNEFQIVPTVLRGVQTQMVLFITFFIYVQSCFTLKTTLKRVSAPRTKRRISCQLLQKKLKIC